MRRWKMAAAAAVLATMSGSAVAQMMMGPSGSSFLSAIRSQDNAKALELINSRGSTVLNYRGDDGEGALHIVTRRRDSVWLSYLLQKGADPNLQSRNGDTPLILAARLGYAEGADILLNRKARVDATNRMGETALIVAVQQRQPQIVRRLLEAGANPDRADNAAGYTARDYARRDRRSAELLRIIESAKKPSKPIVGPVIN